MFFASFLKSLKSWFSSMCEWESDTSLDIDYKYLWVEKYNNNLNKMMIEKKLKLRIFLKQ